MTTPSPEGPRVVAVAASDGYTMSKSLREAIEAANATVNATNVDAGGPFGQFEEFGLHLDAIRQIALECLLGADRFLPA